jgi:hypothetical protein
MSKLWQCYSVPWFAFQLMRPIDEIDFDNYLLPNNETIKIITTAACLEVINRTTHIRHQKPEDKHH